MCPYMGVSYFFTQMTNQRSTPIMLGHVRNRLQQASRLFTTARVHVPTTELSILLAMVFPCILFFPGVLRKNYFSFLFLTLFFQKVFWQHTGLCVILHKFSSTNKQKPDRSSCFSFSPLFAIIVLTTLKISILACVFSLAMFGSKLDTWCPCQHLCCSTLQICMIDLLGPGRVY